jgi:hypothetical protein
MVSVGVVAEGKYLTRDGVKSPEAIFKREIEQNLWVKTTWRPGSKSVHTTSPANTRITPGIAMPRACCSSAMRFVFSTPVFSSGVMLALKSGVMAADAVHEAIVTSDFSPARFAEYGRVLRQGIENMRKLVYAFYDPNFSFRTLTDKYPELAGDVTDCLSGDVDKDFTKLFTAISEFAEVPDALPYGHPLEHEPSALQPV